MNALEAAHAFVAHRFPNCSAAFLAGSVVRGEATSTSDLDIVIVGDDVRAPYRESFHELSWPIETFVHTQQSLERFFALDVHDRTPSLPLMCAEGLVIRDADGTGGVVKARALAILEQGPAPLSAQDIRRRRYAISDTLEDLIGCNNFAEGMFIAMQLSDATADLILGINRAWSGHGKWTLRALRRWDPVLANRLALAVTAYCRHETKNELVRFTDAALDPVGGRLFAGYRMSGDP